MKTVTAFETKDLQIFRTENAARRHEALLDFQQWYKDNELLGNYAGSTVDYKDLIEWLNNNRAEVLTVIQEAL
jgi:hypothetical protein